MISSNLTDLIVVPNPSSDSVETVSETNPRVSPNPIMSEAECTTTELSSAKQDDHLLNVHKIVIAKPTFIIPTRNSLAFKNRVIDLVINHEVNTYLST